MVGGYSNKILFSKILCRLCRRCNVAMRLGCKPKKHDCIKNWDGTSKRMEAQAILDMCTQCPYLRSFVCWWIVSDDDSSMRAVLCHPCSPPNPNEKGMLPAHIIKPEFKADPSHRLKVVSKYFYKLKDLPVSKSRMTSELAKRLKRSWGYMLKQNRHKSLDEFLHAAKAPLHHTFDDHTYCSESWCQPLKAKKEKKKYSNPRGWLSRDTKDGENLFKQIEEITSKYIVFLTPEYASILHPN